LASARRSAATLRLNEGWDGALDKVLSEQHGC
jgi:hypothetical protein